MPKQKLHGFPTCANLYRLGRSNSVNLGNKTNVVLPNNVNEEESGIAATNSLITKEIRKSS